MRYLLLFLLSFNLYAIDCDRHKNYCQIVKNKPTIDKQYAMKLSNILYKVCRKHNIPCNVYNAVLAMSAAKPVGPGVKPKASKDKLIFLRMLFLDTRVALAVFNDTAAAS